MVLTTPAMAEGPLPLELTSEVFGGFEAVSIGQERFNQFTLERAELGVEALVPDTGGELRLEAVRSAGPQSLLGVDGDSLVLRVKRAWAYQRLALAPVTFELRLGLIPDPWLDTLQFVYDLRALAPTAAEGTGFFDASDLGASAQARFLNDRLQLRASLTNGEGRNQREQNEGKNLTLVLEGQPLRFDLMGHEVTALVGVVWRDGSVGPSRQRAHRLGGAAALSSPRWSLGAEVVRALGTLNRPEVEADALAFWARAALWSPWLGVLGRYQQTRPDLDDPSRDLQEITVGLYGDLQGDALAPTAPRLRLHLALRDQRGAAQAGPLPGVPEVNQIQSLLVILEWRAHTRGDSTP